MAGRSTRSLDRMYQRKWLAIALLAGWSVQLLLLWPLPGGPIEISASLDISKKLSPDQLLAMEQDFLFSWIFRSVLDTLGIVSGMLLLRGSRLWVVFLLLSAAGYLAFYAPWATFHAEMFESFDRAMSRALWIWKYPAFVFATLLFPLFILGVAIIAVIDVLKWGRHRHAI